MWWHIECHLHKYGMRDCDIPISEEGVACKYWTSEIWAWTSVEPHVCSNLITSWDKVITVLQVRFDPVEYSAMNYPHFSSLSSSLLRSTVSNAALKCLKTVLDASLIFVIQVQSQGVVWCDPKPIWNSLESLFWTKWFTGLGRKTTFSMIFPRNGRFNVGPYSSLWLRHPVKPILEVVWSRTVSKCEEIILIIEKKFKWFGGRA